MAVSHAIRMRHDLPVAPFRERFLELQEQGLTASVVAARLKWFTPKGDADVHRVRRALGMRPYSDWAGTHIRAWVTVGMAERLAEALELDPHEVGL